MDRLRKLESEMCSLLALLDTCFQTEDWTHTKFTGGSHCTISMFFESPSQAESFDQSLSRLAAVKEELRILESVRSGR